MIVEPIQPMNWVIESAEYTGEVKEQIARLEARYTIQIFKDGWTEIPLNLGGATVTAIDIKKKTGEAHLSPHNGSYALIANRKGTYVVVVKCSTMVAQDSSYDGVRLNIPQATFSTLSLFVPRQDVELRPQDQLYVERQPDSPRGGVKLVARLGAAECLDLRWRTKPTSPVHIEPVLYGDVHTQLTVEEQLARMISIIEYRIAQGETKELRIELPPALNVLSVRGAGIDDWHTTDASEHKVLTVTLNTALKDTSYRLIVEAEQTLLEHSTNYALPEIVLTGVKQERGEMAVTRSGNIELSAQTAEGVNRIDVRELSDLLRSSSNAQAALAFKYHQHPFRVTLALTRHQDHAVLAAIAEQAELATVVSQQGELLTRAVYLIKANKKQYLTVILPTEATLWSCIVDGKSVKPVEGESHELLVPLDAMSDTTASIPVELVYFEHRPALVRMGHLTMQGPVLDVPTTVANWVVYTPNDIKLLRVGGNLARGIAPFEFVEDPFMQVAYAQSTSGTVAPAVVPIREDKDDREVNLSFRTVRKNGILRSEVVDQTTVGGEGGGRNQEPFEALMGTLAQRANETGILPLKIHLPKSGTVHRFNRLMTAQDALKLDATFVHVPMPWIGFAAIGFVMIMLPAGGLARYRKRA